MLEVQKVRKMWWKGTWELEDVLGCREKSTLKPSSRSEVVPVSLILSCARTPTSVNGTLLVFHSGSLAIDSPNKSPSWPLRCLIWSKLKESVTVRALLARNSDSF